jgi:hypothetical protein
MADELRVLHPDAAVIDGKSHSDAQYSSKQKPGALDTLKAFFAELV